MAWDDFDFGGLGDWGTGVFDLPNLSPETNFFSDPGGLTEFFGSDPGGLTNLMVFDNQTGQTIPFSLAMQLDPQAAQEFIGPLVPQGLNQGGSGGFFGNLSGAQLAGLGIGGATAGVGLAGVIQKAMQGDQTAQQTIKRTLGQGTPEEQASLKQALNQFQTLNQFAMGSPAGLMQQLGKRAPLEEGAFSSGLTGLMGQGQLSNQLVGSLLPSLTGMVPQSPMFSPGQQVGQMPPVAGGIPSLPSMPTIPMLKGTPGTPAIPATLGTPGTPGTPATPGRVEYGPRGYETWVEGTPEIPGIPGTVGTPGTPAIPGTPDTPDPNFVPQPYTYPTGQYAWENGAWAWKPTVNQGTPSAGDRPDALQPPISTQQNPAPWDPSMGHEPGGFMGPSGPVGTMPGQMTSPVLDPHSPWNNNWTKPYGGNTTDPASPYYQGPGGTAGGPSTSGGLPTLLGQQGGILNLLSQAASGTLPPELLKLVEQAFQPQLGNIGTQAIEAARQRGFAGGAELLNQAPAGALAGPALSDLQGQMAQAKLGLIPMLGQAAGAFSTPAALRLAGTSQLLNLNQNIMQSLMGVGQQGIQNRLGFLNAATGQLGTQGNLGNLGRLNTGTTLQTTHQPTSLLDAFAPLAGLLGGVGGLLGGFGAMQPRPTYNLNLSGVS